MARRDEFNFQTEDFRAYLRGEIAVLNIQCNVFSAITDLAESGKLIELIQLAERIPEVKALLVINQTGCMGEDQYEDFLHRILGREDGPAPNEDINIAIRKVNRAREINVLNRTISHLAEFKKIVVMGLQGNIVTPFFGAGLSADFRYAADNVEFSLAHLKYGLHPSGALPFFLSHYVGHNKAIEILFTVEKISAQEALDLGLINAIFPTADFEDRCIEELEKMCHLDDRVIHATKLLVNFSRAELSRYFDIESALLH